jgi:crotonobetainyl-CoA:carnitine CoA-transferase CaiB-like acyl-CoA transferase
VIADPHVQAREIIIETDHPTAGRVRLARSAPRYSATPSHLRLPAPTHGQHTDEVLGELGLSPAAITELRAAGVVA